MLEYCVFQSVNIHNLTTKIEIDAQRDRVKVISHNDVISLYTMDDFLDIFMPVVDTLYEMRQP